MRCADLFGVCICMKKLSHMNDDIVHCCCVLPLSLPLLLFVWSWQCYLHLLCLAVAHRSLHCLFHSSSVGPTCVLVKLPQQFSNIYSNLIVMLQLLN